MRWVHACLQAAGPHPIWAESPREEQFSTSVSIPRLLSAAYRRAPPPSHFHRATADSPRLRIGGHRARKENGGANPPRLTGATYGGEFETRPDPDPP